MVIRFGGDFDVRKNPEEVYNFLTDADRFCPLLPDFQNMEKLDATHFTVNLRVGISHIRGNARIKLSLSEADRPRHAVYEGKGDVAGGTVNLTAGFDLEKTMSGTKVNWKGQAQVVGRLASLAGGMLEPLAQKNVKRLINGLQTALA